MLTEAEIDQVVARYFREMARYESAARYVEQRLRRQLRAAALPVLLSSRAKHPEDLREKLRRRAMDARYSVAALLANINTVVTDVAGCRVIVYDPRQEGTAAKVAQETFRLWPGDKSNEVKRADSGYRATHLLVVLDEEGIDLSVRDAVCEVQITSIASHVFNELEHDIKYKIKEGVVPGPRVASNLENLHYASRILDTAVEHLQNARATEVARTKQLIEDAEVLRFVLERAFDRPIVGEVERLFRLLRSSVEPLTVHALEELGIQDAHARGRVARGGDREVDDVICLAIGLMVPFGNEFRDIASQWRGPSTPLKRAILEYKQ